MDLKTYLLKHEPNLDAFAPSNGLFEALSRYADPFDLGLYSIYYDHYSFGTSPDKVRIHIDVDRYPELSYSGELNRNDLMDIYWVGQQIFDDFAKGFGEKVRAMYIKPEPHIYLGEN